jgi:hypothetical protein
VVFEHLFPEELLERKEWTAFILAIIYSTISIIIARLIFPANSGIVSIIFLSIFLLPYFDDILKREEIQERKEKQQSFWRLFSDNADAIRTYFFLFMGIYLAYMAYSFLAPALGYDTGVVFREQLGLEGVRGGATFGFGTFFDILFNNWWVLLACFLIALVAGDGAVFFVAWNASVWGTIFGFRAIEASMHSPMSAVVALLTIVIITLPHVLLEGGAYILAAIAGGIISDEIVEKTDEVRKFVLYFICAVLVFIIFYMVLKVLAAGTMLGILTILVALAILYCMHFIFDDRGEGAIFRYNFYLFCLAIGIFILGAVVETLVLYNSTLLTRVYMAALG